MRCVLTGDTRLARADLLGEEDCESGWEEKHKHTRSDNVAAAVAVSTVAMVVRQLIRETAISHVVLVPQYDKKHRKGPT